MSKVETRFDTKTALAVANAIYCKKGYVKTTEADYGDRKSNKTLVLEELAKENPKYAKKDVSVANEISFNWYTSTGTVPNRGTTQAERIP